MILIPLSFCSFNVSCLFNGLVYYNQWDRFTNWQLCNVMLGVFITILGVILLSWKSASINSIDDISETDRLDTQELEYDEEQQNHQDQDNHYLLVKKNNIHIQ